MKTLAFFNNKGGVGKTTLVYHVAWMLHELGVNVVAVDLDPQSNLTTAFLSEDGLERIWPEGAHPDSILGVIEPLLNRLGDANEPHVEAITDHLGLVAGDLGLSMFEDRLADSWAKCLDDNLANAGDAFRVITAFYRTMKRAADVCGASLVLIDVGPNLGVINRAALVAADHVVVPLGADIFSLQGLRNLGPTLRKWRTGWDARRRLADDPNVPLPSGQMKPIGYVVMQPALRSGHPARAYQTWINRIPDVYSSAVLDIRGVHLTPTDDPHRLATLKHYRSLVPLAQDAQKPIFSLRPADGAIGGHAKAVQLCYSDFKALTVNLLEKCGMPIPRSQSATA